jgi:hypothetical protein
LLVTLSASSPLRLWMLVAIMSLIEELANAILITP